MSTVIDLLKKQTLKSQNWINKITSELPLEKWFIHPEIIDSNFAWQIGHLTLSQYFYTIVLLDEPNYEIADKINIRKYSEFFFKGNKKREIEANFNSNEILNNWKFIQEKSIELLTNLKEIELTNSIFELPTPHPFVKTKEESISWNIKHNMWHCGQISTLKRIIDKPFNLGM